MPRRRTVLRVGLVAVGLFGAMQLVPYGWTHSNPPVIEDTPWPTADAERIARTSCYSCHSNETDWPLYSYVAPMSWLVRSDVDGGRSRLNFSDWDEARGEMDDAVEMVTSGEMPLSQYTLIHRDAALTDAERATLVAALEQLDDLGGGDRDRDDRGGDDDRSGPGGGDDRNEGYDR